MQGHFWILRLTLMYMGQALHKFLLQFSRDALPKCWFKLASSLATPLTEIEKKSAEAFLPALFFVILGGFNSKYVAYHLLLLKIWLHWALSCLKSFDLISDLSISSYNFSGYKARKAEYLSSCDSKSQLAPQLYCIVYYKLSFVECYTA